MDLPVKVHLARCLISWLNMMMAKKKQCNFKHEEDVDRLLAYVEVNFPQIPLHSEVAEQKLTEKAKRMEEKAAYRKYFRNCKEKYPLSR